MTKTDLVQKEREKLHEIFKDLDQGLFSLLENLIDNAAYLAVENDLMKEVMMETGMVKVHAEDKTKQRALEMPKVYRQNVNTYAVIIKTLAAALTKFGGEEEDAFAKWMQDELSKRDN